MRLVTRRHDMLILQVDARAHPHHLLQHFPTPFEARLHQRRLGLLILPCESRIFATEVDSPIDLDTCRWPSSSLAWSCAMSLRLPCTGRSPNSMSSPSVLQYFSLCMKLPRIFSIFAVGSNCFHPLNRMGVFAYPKPDDQ